MEADDIKLTIGIRPGLSWTEALKLRLAGGKAAAGFWDAMARKIANADAQPEPDSVEMCVVGINRKFPDEETYVDLVPAWMRLKSTDESKWPALRFEIDQLVKVTIPKE